MSGLRGALLAQLQRFDDEAYAALANRGLLRRARKDLETQAVALVEDTPDHLTLSFGEHRIRFDARGPAHAQCSCPASGVCQHILAAALGLQQLAEAGAPPTTGEGPDDGPGVLAALQAELMRLDAAELSRHAGKAGYRWAWQFVQDLDPEQGLQVGGERHLQLRFSQPRVGFRYLGGGLASMIADTELAQVEKYRVAAVLAYQRAQGAEPAAPEPAGRPRSGTLDLGRDHALAEPAQDAMQASRERLRASALQLFGESVGLGLSHLSRGIQERYATLAVWAQGADYPRLALQLRRLADHVELLLERAGGADEHRLLDELALAFGLVSALDQAAAAGSAPAHLVGRARSRYEEAGTLTLTGLGALAWRSPAGYVGLTMVFWSAAEQAFFSCADSRPEGQRGFDPIARYKAAGPWSGLGAPAQATGRTLVLSAVQANAAGRLSAADGTSATVLPEAREPFASTLQPQADWALLRRQRAQARQSLLAEAQPMKDWVVLQPARFGKPAFDATRQTLTWPLFDAQGQQLDAELPYDRYHQHALQRIEQLRDDELGPGTLLVGRLQPEGGGLVLVPLSLVRARAEAGISPVDCLHFDATVEPDFAARWLARMPRLGPAGVPPAAATVRPSGLPTALREHRHGLQRLAERGMAPDQALQMRAELDAAAARAARAGLSAFERLGPSDPGRVAARLLQSHYLCLQYERLFDEGAGLSP